MNNTNRKKVDFMVRKSGTGLEHYSQFKTFLMALHFLSNKGKNNPWQKGENLEKYYHKEYESYVQNLH